MKIQRESFRHAQNVREIATLCWQLSDLLEENFVGYESDCSCLRDLAIEFEKKFDDLVDNPYV